MFDKVYVLAEGQCIYQGSGPNIVPYLQQIGLTCPLTYNPADFSKSNTPLSPIIHLFLAKNN